MKKRNIILITCLSLILIFVAWRQGVQSRTKAYYSGEAVSFQNNLLFATVNTGALELFKLEGEEIVRTAAFKPKFVKLPKSSENFSDLLFDVDGNLNLYLIDGAYLYKYDINNPYSPRQTVKIRDNAWDWFLQIDKTDDYLVTIGTKEIKYWNRDLQVINSYKLTYDNAENVSFSSDSKYIFTITDNVLSVYDTADRKVKTNIMLSLFENNQRKPYYDTSKGELYIADDDALKVFDLSGKELRRFKHTSDHAYDVMPSTISSSVYFSDGIGIVRNKKNDLEPIDWKHTTDIGAGNGWTMGMRVVGDSEGDKVVAFSSSEILVFDNELELIDQYTSSQIDEGPIETLSLKLDKTHAFPGDYLELSGGGFRINEELSIEMKNQKWSVVTDENGRFKRTINVVNDRPQPTDIKVTGLESKLTYSISFKID